jgi:hypothetical protein
MRHHPQADIDRRATLRSDEFSYNGRLSELRDHARYVLLGEPGSGKSSALLREASAAGIEVVTAKRFAGGHRPAGTTVFIDALEEYRIGEAGVDRLDSLIEALENSPYSGWRIACRAISLPPADALRIERHLGSFETAQLEPLDVRDQRDILTAHGVDDPNAFLQRVDAMGAGALLGNPSTLLLLHKTIDRSTVAITTRGGLLAEATRQMAYEVNREMPERSDRPPPGTIIASVETACMVLLLSNRSDLWMHGAAPVDENFVTRDDLLPARVDTQALRYALDTSMFSGDGGSFVPTHRFIAEYLAGNALARATTPSDAAVPALPLTRAVAFLSGDDDRPAPALTGIFAWFVTRLATTVHAPRALELVRLEPEAVLFHADAALLPTEHRRALLDAVGRTDPWFLGGNRGSTGIAGLAGSDIAYELAMVLTDPSESDHRRAMVLMALAAGRPVPELDGPVNAIFLNETRYDFSHRRAAMRALANIRGATVPVRRAMLGAIAAQASSASVQLRVELLSHLVPEAGAEEVRDALTAYGRTGDGVMGYARPLGDRLVQFPMPQLFDDPTEARRHTGKPRLHEAAAVIDMALAAAIRGTPGLTAERLLRWLTNAGLDDLSDPEKELRSAISSWLDVDASREAGLFDAIAASEDEAERWQSGYHFERLTGRVPSADLRELLVARAEQADDEAVGSDGTMAFQLIRPFEQHPDLYWRLHRALEGRPEAQIPFQALCLCELDGWRPLEARRQHSLNAVREARLVTEREWFLDHVEELRSGQPRGLIHAAEIHLGYRDRDEASGERRLAEWIGNDAVLQAIHAGWRVVTRLFSRSARDAGLRSADRTVHNVDFIPLVLADRTVAAGDVLDLPPPLLLEIAHGAHALAHDREEAVRAAALTAFLETPDADDALLDFWLGWLDGGGHGLAFEHDLDPRSAIVRSAVERLLGTGSPLAEEALRSALGLASRVVPPAQLAKLAASARAGQLSEAASLQWGFIAWSLAPESHSEILAREFTSPAQLVTFIALMAGPLGKLPCDHATSLSRAEAVVEHLGPANPPEERAPMMRSDAFELVAAAIDSLANSPTPLATAALQRLDGVSALSAWSPALGNASAKQLSARRQSEFRPPAPSAVAAALLAGPPATSGDLRAVVEESLRELVHDIRHGDTSPWKGFWNRPSATGKAIKSRNTPKIENDCRDLLTDRLADRLRRFGIPVKLIQTEDRSGNDRRADIMILVGDGSAALPIEAKRHWNAELWTAIDDQLLPYCRTAGSNGHGIYLVFWFGAKWKTPANKKVGPKPTTAKELHAALEEQLPAHAGNITVVVVDVSEPIKVGSDEAAVDPLPADADETPAPARPIQDPPDLPSP